MEINFFKERYGSMEEDLVVAMAQSGDHDAEQYLLLKYHRFVISKVKDYYLQGGDLDDLIQEGLIGLHKGIHSYRSNEATTFRGFADLCIKRQVITAIRTANRLKNQPLNNSISINESPGDEDSRMLDEVLGSSLDHNPEDIVMGKETLAQMEENIRRKLSSLEWDVFYEFIKGSSFEEISNELKLPIKSVYNAIERGRKKISEYLVSRDLA